MTALGCFTNPSRKSQKQKVNISLTTEKVVCLTGEDKTVRRVNDKKQGVKSGQNSAKKEAKQRQKGG